MQVEEWQYVCVWVEISNTVITVALRQKEKEITKMFSLPLCWKCFYISKVMVPHILWHIHIEIALFFLQWFASGHRLCMVQLVCEWVISCPWMKSSVVNERHSLNSPSHRWREETKRNSTITRLRGNKCLSLGSNSFPVQHTEPFTNYLLPTG